MMNSNNAHPALKAAGPADQEIYKAIADNFGEEAPAKKKTFKAGDRVAFGYSIMQFVGIVVAATDTEVEVSGVETGCLHTKRETVTISGLQYLDVLDERGWVKYTLNEPAFADSMSMDRFLALTREIEGLEREKAQGRGTSDGDFRISEIDLLLMMSPWFVHQTYGCISKREARLIEVLEEVSDVLDGHPDMACDDSRVRACNDKIGGALKDVTDSRVMPEA